MLPLNPPKSVTNQMRWFENFDIAYQQVQEMQQIQKLLNPSHITPHQNEWIWKLWYVSTSSWNVTNARTA